MTKKELRKISITFRTLSSQMLKIDSQEEIGMIQSFFDFITKTEVIRKYIISCHKEDYNFDELFSKIGYQNKLRLPSDPEILIDFEFQLIQYILNGKKQLFWYGHNYTSSNKFADMISAFMRKVIEPFVVALRNYLEICLIDADDDESGEVPAKKKIFLSYCQKDSDIANIIDSQLKEKIGEKAEISRDIRDVNYHESFKAFMRRIQDHDYVILLISDHYLKSRNCMYEVTEAIKDSRYDKKITYIVLQEEDKSYLSFPDSEPLAANVYTPDGQKQYTLYWQDQEKNLQTQIEEIGDPVYAINQAKELSIIRKILLDLPDFFAFIYDHKGLTLKTHISEAFCSMLSFMGLLD